MDNNEIIENQNKDVETFSITITIPKGLGLSDFNAYCKEETRKHYKEYKATHQKEKKKYKNKPFTELNPAQQERRKEYFKNYYKKYYDDPEKYEQHKQRSLDYYYIKKAKSFENIPIKLDNK